MTKIMRAIRHWMVYKISGNLRYQCQYKWNRKKKTWEIAPSHLAKYCSKAKGHFGKHSFD